MSIGCVLSSVGASENLNKQFCKVVIEMVLNVEKSLEMLVNAEDEVLLALEVLRERKEELVEKLEKVEIPVEEVSPVIEQQLDSESFESTSYSIDVGYGKSTYDAGNYYDLVSRDGEIGASMTAVFSAYEHELLKEVQDMASEMRSAAESNRPYVDAQIDMNLKEKKNSVKLLSFTLWCAMYDGKLTFN